MLYEGAPPGQELPGCQDVIAGENESTRQNGKPLEEGSLELLTGKEGPECRRGVGASSGEE